MQYNHDRALELLRIGSGNPAARFRDGQEEAIRTLIEGKSRLLVVQKTGWGKSFVYFIAVKLLREAGSGPAILISPLLSLMRNQIAAAERMGVRAVTINSANQDDWDDVDAQIAGNEADVVLIAPERLGSDRFADSPMAREMSRVSLLIIDEAHCISDWGHDFRPHYRLIQRAIRSLPPNTRLIATTATANNRVMDDLSSVLGSSLKVSRGDLNRPSLALQTIVLPRRATRLAWLADYLPRIPGSGIVYVLTKRDAWNVSSWLQSRGIDAQPYVGGAECPQSDLEEALISNRVKALVATTALGMGFDKPDLAFVIHYQTPGSVVAYYQQVGRAGRALPAARGVLLSGEEDTRITTYFSTSSFPKAEDVAAVMGVLESNRDGLSEAEISKQTHLDAQKVRNTLVILSLESRPPVVKAQRTWQLTAAPLTGEIWERVDRLTVLRQQEQEQMQQYVGLSGGHMEFLINALDGDPGSATIPPLPRLSTYVERKTLIEAWSFVRGCENWW